MKKIFYLITIILGFNSNIFSQTFTITSKGSLPESRTKHEVAQLPNGKIIAIGGFNSSNKYLKTCHIYNLNNWVDGAVLNSSRASFNISNLNNGNLLIFGGYDENNMYNSKSEVYSYLQNRWNIVDTFNINFENAVSTQLKNGNTIIAGGNSLNKTMIFNQSNYKWFEVGLMNYNHGLGMSLTLLDDGRVLAAGGYNKQFTFEVFDPNSGTWSSLNLNAPYGIYNHKVVKLKNGKLLFIGSSNFSNISSSFILDPVNLTTQVVGKLYYFDLTSNGILLDNGNVAYYNTGNYYSAQSYYIQEFDINTLNWTYKNDNFGYGFSYAKSVKLNNGKYLFIGGENLQEGYVASNTISELTQSTNINCNITDTVKVEIDKKCLGQNQIFKIKNYKYSLEYYLENNNGVLLKFNSDTLSLSNEEVTNETNFFRIYQKPANCPLINNNNIIKLDLTNGNNDIVKINITKGNQFFCSNDTIQVNATNSIFGNKIIWSNKTNGSLVNINKEQLLFANSIDVNGCFSSQSNAIFLRKLLLDDIIVTNAKLCLKDSIIKLDAKPTGGIWTGNNVNNTGIFKNKGLLPSETYKVNYNLCGFNKEVQVTTFPLNANNLKLSQINWGLKSDTICVGNYFTKIDSSSKNQAYKFFVNQKLSSTLIGNNSPITFNFNTYNISNLNLKVITYPYNANSVCPLDTLSFSNTFKVETVPNQKLNIIRQDTVCSQSEIKVAVTNPEKNLYYSFYSAGKLINKINSGIQNSISSIYPPLSSNLSIEITNPKCNYKANVPINYVIYYNFNSRILGDDAFQQNSNINFEASTINFKYKWLIDGDSVSNAKKLYTHKFSNVGIHNYKLYSYSNYGCIDSISKNVTIFNSPKSNYKVCIADTLQSPIHNKFSNIFKSIRDKDNNLILVGSRDYETYDKRFYMYIEKYDYNNKLLWVKEQKPVFPFGNSHLSSVDVDSEGNIYVCGNFASKIFKFDNGQIVDNNNYSIIPPHAYLAKYDQSGNCIWVTYSNYDYYSSTLGSGFSDIKIVDNSILLMGFGIRNFKQNNDIVNLESMQLASGIFKFNTDGKFISATKVGNEKYVVDISKLYPFFNPRVNESSTYFQEQLFTNPVLFNTESSKAGIYGFEYSRNGLKYDFYSFYDVNQNKLVTTDTLNSLSVLYSDNKIDPNLNTDDFQKKPLISKTFDGFITASNFNPYIESSFQTYDISQVKTLSNSSKVFDNPNGVYLKKFKIGDENLSWEKFIPNLFLKFQFYDYYSQNIILIGEYKKSIFDSDINVGLQGNSNSQIAIIALDNLTGNIISVENLYAKCNLNILTSTINFCGKLSIVLNSICNDTIVYKTNNYPVNMNSKFIFDLQVNAQNCGESNNCKDVQFIENEELNSILIYPNPTKSTLNFANLPLSIDGNDIYIYDEVGKLIIEKNITSDNSKIDFNLKSGIYIVKIKNKSAVTVRKILVQE